MGHEFCGAVGAAMGDTSVHPPSLKLLLDGIQEGLPLARLSAIMDKKARDREAVLTNVHNQVATLMKDPLVKDKVDAGVLIVIGAFYSLSSGVVDFVTAV
jgi:carbonic anhydrase|tara:strand:- start:70 stop:369 length:300 start_codon:yes stop_codon:yes gene_type:complete